MHLVLIKMEYWNNSELFDLDNVVTKLNKVNDNYMQSYFS